MSAHAVLRRVAESLRWSLSAGQPIPTAKVRSLEMDVESALLSVDEVVSEGDELQDKVNTALRVLHDEKVGEIDCGLAIRKIREALDG